MYIIQGMKIMASNIDVTMQPSPSPPPPPTPAPTSEASGCPVLARGADADPPPPRLGIWNRWFSPRIAPTTTATTTTTTTRTTATVAQCPVGRGSESVWTHPASIEEAARHSHFPAPGQRALLSTQRVISSIPRGDDDARDAPSPSSPSSPSSSSAADGGPSSSTSAVPSHQPPDSVRWQYPSEQQFYNAMLRKGHRPPVESIPSVLRIHNAVNERSWHQVRRWEREIRGNYEPRLVKFVGRPKDLSPRAWFNSRVLGTGEPFDRHDWYVEDATGGGGPRRYVIDFYEGEGGGGGGAGGTPAAAGPPSMYIDVRPALDSPSAAADRMAMFAREALPGLASAWDALGRSSPPPQAAPPSSGGGVRVAGTDGAGAGGEDGIRRR